MDGRTATRGPWPGERARCVGFCLVTFPLLAQPSTLAFSPQPQETTPANQLFESVTLPAFGSYVEAMGRLGTALKIPWSGAYTGVLSGFAAVHDARRGAAEVALTAANAAMDRDLRAAGIAGFRLDNCSTSPAACPELRALSPATQATVQRYLNAQDRYLAWSDLGNVTGRGWTEGERQAFLQNVSAGVLGAVGEQGVKKVQDMARPASWDPETTPVDMVRDDVTAAATSRLDAFLSEMSPPSADTARHEDAQVHPAAGPEAERALQALADQGSAVDRLNRESAEAREGGPSYVDGFAARVDQDAGRLGAAARDSDDAARQFHRDMNREADRLRARLDALRALRLQPPQPAATSFPASTQMEDKPASSKERHGDAQSKAPEHCPGGVFKCPNGLPWPGCGHAEKYRCPPPEHAAEAARHRAGETDSTPKPPVPKP